jgi:hypothetical protein
MEIYETEDPVCAPETIIDSPDNSDIDQDHIKPTEAKARFVDSGNAFMDKYAQ